MFEHDKHLTTIHLLLILPYFFLPYLNIVLVSGIKNKDQFWHSFSVLGDHVYALIILLTGNTADIPTDYPSYGALSIHPRYFIFLLRASKCSSFPNFSKYKIFCLPLLLKKTSSKSLLPDFTFFHPFLFSKRTALPFFRTFQRTLPVYVCYTYLPQFWIFTPNTLFRWAVTFLTSDIPK